MKKLEEKIELLAKRVEYLIDILERPKVFLSTPDKLLNLRDRIKQYIYENFLIDSVDPSCWVSSKELSESVANGLGVENSKSISANVGYVMSTLGMKSKGVRIKGIVLKSFNIKRK